MIKSITINNYRCWKYVNLRDCGRINVIAGDNGSGKTALLEALFLTLSGNLEVSLRLRAQRGLDGNYSGPHRSIEEAIWREYFHNLEWSEAISVEISGHGLTNRTLRIDRSLGQFIIPFDHRDGKSPTTSLPLTFVWTDSAGKEREVRPSFEGSSLRLPSSGEDLPDFFYMSAGMQQSGADIASRFSEIRRQGGAKQFISALTEEFDWIEDLSVEAIGGSPLVFATLKNCQKSFPLASVSGGINRIMGLMVTIASRQSSVILVDEIEDGIYFEHMPGLLRSIWQLAEQYNCQLFVSTHSEDLIRGILDAAGDNLHKVVYWRPARIDGTHTIERFSGDSLRLGMETGGEVR